MIRTATGIVAAALLLGACGTNSEDRTTGGAAAGAATGAGVGALGGPVGVAAGALVGGGAGAVAGATTTPDQVNLGRPPWSNPEARIPFVDDRGRGRSGTSTEIRQVQQELRDHGYDPGAVDGVWGPRTSDAVARFQQASGIPATGRIDSRTRQMLAGSASGGSGVTPAPSPPSDTLPD